jgi:hypothetical protein
VVNTNGNDKDAVEIWAPFNQKGSVRSDFLHWEFVMTNQTGSSMLSAAPAEFCSVYIQDDLTEHSYMMNC